MPPSPFLSWCSPGWAPSSFLSEVFTCLFAGLSYRSTTRLLAHWTRVPTCPASGGKSSSSGMKPTTSLWACTQGPPTPSPSRPVQQRASGPQSPLGLPPKFQVSLLIERGEGRKVVWFFPPFLVFLGAKRGRASYHLVVLEQLGRCGP